MLGLDESRMMMDVGFKCVEEFSARFGASVSSFGAIEGLCITVRRKSMSSAFILFAMNWAFMEKVPSLLHYSHTTKTKGAFPVTSNDYINQSLLSC